MSRPSVNFEAIPSELKALSQWVLWRRGALRPNGKRAKPPRMPNGNLAKPNDPTTWNLFEDVKAAFLDSPNGYDGVGFMLASEDGFVAIDLDNCVGKDGAVAPWARRIMDTLPTYWERSPSGTGLRAFLGGTLPAGYGNGINRPLAAGGRIEVYQIARYVTVTGAHVAGTPTTIQPLQRELEAVLTRELPSHSTGWVSMNDPFSSVPRTSYRVGDLIRHPPWTPPPRTRLSSND